MEVLLENSKSKKGKHVVRTFLFKVDSNGSIQQIELPGKPVRPTYKVGEAKIVNIPNKGVYVYLFLLRNIYGRVMGRIIVINDGKTVLVMKYRKLKLKLIDGDDKHVVIVKRIFEQLKIPVKKININKKK
ncbi:hypothetical protein SULI_09610 [Saccharolobus solfataricus]|uniref:Uncharacterized protein n=3 Tax=Saccharolobus solfataricus TaxID=2287 RepID=Q97ZK7_SACS2|nr:hypothetical protein [Saccharolobus solfataricus]AAK41181.1 Hypothetical protein SSO0900 [Saccharolobus solfataricus P2]AKA74135.1 hypothetical protein SULB_1912 [Saccharolobus solfataricus]AKA76833.1 hypothetical protein SULC_1910 [Saccharolobus solfataricus]AKA79526.1 hypothetical protein SULA_1911 [Saccharolobus solfataricus]AZF68614.1 hypothetical protein SULG_09610 [Saccharolobus solfataricus]